MIQEKGWLESVEEKMKRLKSLKLYAWQFERALREWRSEIFYPLVDQVSADCAIFVRWALSDPSGRQTLFFKKSNKKTTDDEGRERLSAVWHTMFLERRDDYFTERIWRYMSEHMPKKPRLEKSLKVEITFNGKRPDADLDKDSHWKIELPRTFMEYLDKGRKLHREIKRAIGDRDDEAHLVSTARRLSSSKDIARLQRAGIITALEEWNRDKKLKKYLNRVFFELYGKELKKEKEISRKKDANPPIYPYELSSRFLFLWQNMVMYYPEVRKVYIFAYSREIERPPDKLMLRSSLSFFSRNERFKVSAGNEEGIFKSLRLFEDAGVGTEREGKLNDEFYPKWKMALSGLERSKQEIEGRSQDH